MSKRSESAPYKPAIRCVVPSPKNQLYSIELQKKYNGFNVCIDYDKNVDIKDNEILNNRQNCILKYINKFPISKEEEINYLQELVNDPGSPVSKFISDHLAYDQYLKELEEEKAKVAEAKKIKEQEREEHFFELQPISVRTAISLSKINDPVAGEADLIVSTITTSSGESFDTISFKDLEDKRYKMKFKGIKSGSIQVGQRFLIQIRDIRREEGTGKKIYFMKRLKIIKAHPSVDELLRIARDGIKKYYREIGIPLLFKIVLEKICDNDKEIESVLCPNGIRDLRTSQPRVKKLLALCRVRLPTDDGHLHETNQKFLTFQWVKN